MSFEEEPIIIETTPQVLETCVGDIALSSDGPVFEHAEEFSVVLAVAPEADFDFPL